VADFLLTYLSTKIKIVNNAEMSEYNLAAIFIWPLLCVRLYAISNFVLSKITLKLISAFNALNTRIIVSIVALLALFSSFDI